MWRNLWISEFTEEILNGELQFCAVDVINVILISLLFIINFKYNSQLFLAFYLLNLNK